MNLNNLEYLLSFDHHDHHVTLSNGQPPLDMYSIYREFSNLINCDVCCTRAIPKYGVRHHATSRKHVRFLSLFDLSLFRMYYKSNQDYSAYEKSKFLRIANDNSNVAMIGSNRLIEYYGDLSEPSIFYCKVCAFYVQSIDIVSHLGDFDHTEKYLAFDFPDVYNQMTAHHNYNDDFKKDYFPILASNYESIFGRLIPERYPKEKRPIVQAQKLQNIADQLKVYVKDLVRGTPMAEEFDNENQDDDVAMRNSVMIDSETLIKAGEILEQLTKIQDGINSGIVRKISEEINQQVLSPINDTNRVGKLLAALSNVLLTHLMCMEIPIELSATAIDIITQIN